MGAAPNRSLRHQDKQAGAKVRLFKRGRQSRNSGCPSSPMAVKTGICISPNHTATTGDQEDKGRGSTNNFNSAILAQEAMVFMPAGNVSDRPLGAFFNPEAPLARAILPSSSGQSPLDGLELEREMLRARGFSEGLVSTLLQSRKLATTKIYTRVWRKFLEFHTGPDSREIPITPVLEFLQKVLNLSLSVNTLKVHVSALGALYGYNVAGNRWIARFISACERSEPVHIPRVPPWDLNPVLEALTRPPLEPLDSISLKHLSLKTVLLVALTSARRVSDIQALSIEPPFLLTFQDQLILKPDPSYLPKVAGKFHRSQEIHLPSFF
ncbi:uncharacterized protein [Dendrobates tinctorius]|uniref:uncharacterized protein n=1 Tax=Dendrobates tinctorius TaxID=92724 RepID=UPI003CCA055A